MRADPRNQAAAEAFAQNIGGDFERGIIRIAQSATQFSDGEERLGHVFFRRKVNARSRFGGERRERRRGRLLHLPVGEQLFQFVVHLSGGEIAVHRQHDVLGEVVALVEGDQIFTMNARQVRVFRLPAVGRILAVQNARQLAAGDVAGVVIAARDGAAVLRERQIQFVLAELRIREHILKDGQHPIGGFLQSRKAHAGAGFIHSGFHRPRDIFQLLVDLVAGLGFGAARTQYVGHDLRKAALVTWIEQSCRCGSAPGPGSAAARDLPASAPACRSTE